MYLYPERAMYCGIIKVRGGQFSWIAHILQFRGDVILWMILNPQKQIGFITLIYEFVEDVNLWMRGTPAFHKN